MATLRTQARTIRRLAMAMRIDLSTKLADASDGKKSSKGASVGLFIPLPADLAKQFPAEGREVDDDNSPAHATFFYIGDFDPSGSSKLVKVLEEALAGLGPVKATLDGVGFFDNDDYLVAFSKVSFNKDVSHFRRAIRDGLNRAEISYQERSPDIYKAHSTLTYLPAGSAKSWGGPEPSGSWTFNSIEVWGLPQLHKISLGGEAR